MNVVKNYHTHTFRCGHASGDVDDYCVAAKEHELQVLGMLTILRCPTTGGHASAWIFPNWMTTWAPSIERERNTQSS